MQGSSKRSAIFAIIALFVCAVPLVSQPVDDTVILEEIDLSSVLQLPSTAVLAEQRPKPLLEMSKRLAIIGIGAIPFTIFYTDIIFDTIRYISNGFDLQYAPWPFKNQYSALVGRDERFLRLGASLGASLIIGFASVVIPYR
jgi:hypothetical protein